MKCIRRFLGRCQDYRGRFGRLPRLWDWRAWVVLFFPRLDNRVYPRYTPPPVSEQHGAVAKQVGWTKKTRNIPGYMSAEYMQQVMGMVRREQTIINAQIRGEHQIEDIKCLKKS